MSCVLLKYVAIITFILCLPIEIGCCTMTTSAIISLMSENPNFQQDPCYIKWKAAQDAELARLWTRRDELERSAHEYNRRKMENDAIERANRQRSYTSSTSVSIKKQSSIWKILGGIVGVIVGICCCAACVTAVCDNDDPTTNTATNIPQNASPQVPLTSVVTGNTLGNQSTFTNGNDSNLTASLSSSQQDSRANVPLMPKRQNSLPSYDDVVKMATAPPME